MVMYHALITISTEHIEKHGYSVSYIPSDGAPKVELLTWIVKHLVTTVVQDPQTHG